MCKPLALSVLFALLVGCASEPAQQGISGIWINQTIIDAAATNGRVLESGGAVGQYQEWNIDTDAERARVTNGFEYIAGMLLPEQDGSWTFSTGEYRVNLKSQGDVLTQSAWRHQAEETFTRIKTPLPGYRHLGSHFKHALNTAVLGGNWKIIAGPGAGNRVQFQASGQVTGLPDQEKFTLCLGGDCGNWTESDDYLWLGHGNKGSAWILRRTNQQLEIFQTLNRSRPDEIPSYIAGPRQWLLIKQ